MDRSTISAVRPVPGADHRDELVEQPLDQRRLGGVADHGDGVAAGVHVGGELALDDGQELVAWPEQSDHRDARGDGDGVLVGSRFAHRQAPSGPVLHFGTGC
jgi:hypothetical protein